MKERLEKSLLCSALSKGKHEHLVEWRGSLHFVILNLDDLEKGYTWKKQTKNYVLHVEKSEPSNYKRLNDVSSNPLSKDRMMLNDGSQSVFSDAFLQILHKASAHFNLVPKLPIRSRNVRASKSHYAKYLINAMLLLFVYPLRQYLTYPPSLGRDPAIIEEMFPRGGENPKGNLGGQSAFCITITTDTMNAVSSLKWKMK